MGVGLLSTVYNVNVYRERKGVKYKIINIGHDRLSLLNSLDFLKLESQKVSLTFILNQT